MRFRVSLWFAAVAATCSSSATADDVGAAGRGVVRVIVIAQDYADEENSSVSLGTGFAISPHRVVTNAHVVEEVRNPYADSVVAVVPAEGSHVVPGRLVAFDRKRDLAVLDVGTIRLEPLTIYSGPVASGNHSAALGYPGNVDSATITSVDDLITPSSPVRSEGNISSEKNILGLPALLHTAAISRGNSGGPLVDGCGRVLGVNTYVTNSGSGDAPFGFAVVARELMAFLRENGESFQQIGTACITYAEQLQRDQDARDVAARRQEASQRQLAAEHQRRIDSAKARAEDSRDNHVAASALLAVLSLIAAGLGIALFVKDNTKAAVAASIAAVVGLAGATYAFLSRPTLNVTIPPLTAAASAEVPVVSGPLTCRVLAERSRITVSSTDDLSVDWTSSGCMNGRTQYVQVEGLWSKVLVPNGSETAYVQQFDPAQGEYVSTRYLLPLSEMDRLRNLRGTNSAKSCTSDTGALQQLAQLTERLKSSLPAEPNERIVYSCEKDN